MNTPRNATLASPLVIAANNPGDPVYIVVADDAPGPFPRIGDVTRRAATQWEAWPMGAEMRTTFRTRREAVRFLADIAAA